MRQITKLFSTRVPKEGKKQISGNMNRNTRVSSRNIFLTGLVLLLFMVSSASAQEKSAMQPEKLWSLQDCIEYALKNNLTVQQSYLSVKSAKSDLLQSKLNFLPAINAGGTEYSNWGRAVDMATYQYSNQKITQFNMSVNGNFTLFNGLQNVNKLRMQEFNYLASKYNSDEIKDNISLNIAAAYLQILYNIEQVNNAKRQLATTQDQINLTKKEVEVGKVARGNLLDIQAQGANDEVNVIKAQNTLMLAYLDLMQLLDLKSNTQFDIQKPDLMITHRPSLLPIENIYNKAVGIMPEIKYAEYNVKSAGAALAVSRGQRSPALSLVSSYGNNYSSQIKTNNEITPFGQQMRENYNIAFGFNLQIPIFNRFSVGTAIAKSKISLENANLNLAIQKNNLRKSIEQAYTDALASYQTYEASLKSVESLKEAFKYAQEKFNVGLLNSTDFTQAKNNYYNAESTLTSAKYDYIFKTKLLDFYLGRSLSLKDIATPEGSIK
ncbi:MAG: TolC family protein [Bacteroidales bacterium]|nr:TolC family protein [Bacteroidales bacterium]